MKRIILIIISILLMSTMAQAAIINLRATWTANAETDLAGYNLYRTDGTRLKLNPTIIVIPAVQYDFSVTVPDNSFGIMTFVLTAVDATGNESLDSNTASRIYDLVPPVRPTGFIINFR
jgi:hypothetical protein